MADTFMGTALDKIQPGKRLMTSCLLLCLVLINSSQLHGNWGQGNFPSFTHSEKFGLSNQFLSNAGEEGLNISQFSPVKADSNTGLPGKQIRFEKISIEKGLSQSAVTCIIQDSKGFIWIGTEDGLNKFDGYEFTIYRHNPDDPNSISDNSISVIYEDQAQVLWIGTNGKGLNRLDRDTQQFIHYQHNPDNLDSLANDSIRSIVGDTDGNLWIGTEKGLDRFDPGTQEFFHYIYDQNDIKSLGDNWVEDLYLDHAGILWIGTLGGGLNRYEPVTDDFVRYRHDIINPNRISSDYVSSIDEDRNGNLWVGTSDGGLNYFNQDSEEFYYYRMSRNFQRQTKQIVINSIEIDSQGLIWVGNSGGGIHILDPGTGQIEHLFHDPGDPSSLSSNDVNVVFSDRSGIIWVGTYGGGISRFDPINARFTHYRHIVGNSESISSNNVTSIAADQQGNLWVGTLGGGLNYYNRVTGQVQHFQQNPDDPLSLSSDDIVCVLVDQFGDVWIGTRRDGLNKYSPNLGQFTHYRHDPDNPDSLSMDSINVLFEDRDGMLWIGTDGGGLDRIDRTTGRIFHFRNIPGDSASLSSNIILSILEDRTGKFWIGTGGGGINILNPGSGKFSHFTHDPVDPTSLGDTSIYSIYEDRTGTIWIGTDGSGLDKFVPSTGEFLHFRAKDGLPNNVVYGILEDNQGNLWFSTNFGLSKFDPIAETFKNFDVSDGLQSNEFNFGAYTVDGEGRMYFGGINGMTAFVPENIRETLYYPPVVFTGLRQNGENILKDQSVEDLDSFLINWNNNNFEFEFVALNFSHPDKTRYAYKLEGFDREWNYIGESRIGRYTNLPGGSYTLLVRATNSDGLWNDESAKLEITVVPPFWETLWFIGLVTIFIMGSVITGYRLRIRSIESRSQELESQVKLRTEEIERRRMEMESLYEADEIIDQNLTQESRLKALADVSIDLLQADKSAIFVWDENIGEYSVVASRGFNSPGINNLSLAIDDDFFGKSHQTGELVVLDNLNSEQFPEVKTKKLVEFLITEGIQAAIYLPIRFGNEIYGMFNVNYSHADAVGEAELRVIRALTQHSALSIQNAQLFEQLRELAIREERSRLARDLHDSAKQKAFAALAQLGAAGGMIDQDLAASKEHLLEAEDLVHEVLQELSILIQEMYPVALRERGLASSVREYVFEWENQCEIEINLTVNNEMRLPLEIEQSLYRVIQEALANIARHSSAHAAEIKIVYEEDRVRVTICDDGIGFDVDKQPSGLGLRSMRERIELIKGELSIRSNPAEGTLIMISSPLTVVG